MSPKALASVFVGVGLVLLVVAIVCRFKIASRAVQAGVPRSFWLEKVDFPGRQTLVVVLGLSLALGMAAMVMGFVFTAKASNERKAEQKAADTAPARPAP